MKWTIAPLQNNNRSHKGKQYNTCIITHIIIKSNTFLIQFSHSELLTFLNKVFAFWIFNTFLNKVFTFWNLFLSFCLLQFKSYFAFPLQHMLFIFILTCAESCEPCSDSERWSLGSRSYSTAKWSESYCSDTLSSSGACWKQINSYWNSDVDWPVSRPSSLRNRHTPMVSFDLTWWRKAWSICVS